MSVPASHPLPDRLLTPDDLATLFGVGKSSLRGWVRDGRLPPPIRIGKGPRWTPDQIRECLDGRSSATRVEESRP